MRGAILWALLRRELHLLARIPFLFTLCHHRSITTTKAQGFWPIVVACGCGRVFWPSTVRKEE